MRVYPFVYNNYYNRIFKKKDTYNQYLNAGTQLGFFNDINFNPNDGITATQVLSLTDAVASMPDYLLVCDENDEIVSRWFVIETKRLRRGQYQLQLHRDLMADFYDQIVNSKIFLEKGVCSIENNLIFNAENYSVNQIKKNEIPLKDNTDVAWLVGYMSPGESGGNDLTIKFGTKEPNVSYESTSIESFLEGLPRTKATVAKNYGAKFSIDDYNSKIGYEYIFTDKLQSVKQRGIVNYLKFTYSEGPELLERNFDNKLAGLALNIYLGIPRFVLSADISYANYNSVVSYNNKIVKADEKYYRLSIKRTHKNFGDVIINNSSQLLWQYFVSLTNEINSEITTISGYPVTIPTFECFKVYGETEEVEIVANEIDVYDLNSFSFVIPNDRPKLNDAPYCMFCMPFGEIDLTATGTNYKTNKYNAMNIAAGIFVYGGSYIYDIQLLPYCPIVEARESGVSSFVSLYPEKVIKIPSAKQVILWADYSSGTFDITNYNFSVNETDPIEFKVNDKARFIRLCSPNYNGVFEMSPYKNRGIDFINVDYNYKPFSPYIHLSPNFKGLYGSDYNDARGLICGGDFSIASTSDAWVNYEINNKNYQNMFNRQIENMEVQHKYQRISDIAGAVSGTMQGAASGFAMSGGNAAAAISSGVLSAGAGVFDVYAQEQLRNEALDYTQDQFAYGLDNIKALPYSLTRISAFNENNKIFPFVEEYDCTEEERSAFYDKMKYNGMQLNIITTIQTNMNTNNYLGDPGNAGENMAYFKGKIIRIEGIDDDYHILNAIAGELNKGVFI